jgi:hypothetical protein
MRGGDFSMRGDAVITANDKKIARYVAQQNLGRDQFGRPALDENGFMSDEGIER